MITVRIFTLRVRGRVGLSRRSVRIRGSISTLMVNGKVRLSRLRLGVGLVGFGVEAE